MRIKKLNEHKSAIVKVLPFPICPNLLSHCDYLYLNLVCVEIKMFQNIVLLTSNCFTNVLIKVKLNQNRKQARIHRKKKDPLSSGKNQPMSPIIQHFKCQSNHPRITHIPVLIFATWNSEETMVKQLSGSQTCPTRIYPMTFLNIV